MKGRIRVLVVEDSLTVRKRLVEVLESDPSFVVVGEAKDGKEAIELCQRLRPDVVTLDMMLPVLSGVAVTEHIMAYCPTPILIVSASVNRGELFKTYDALAAGAVDVLEKPRAGAAGDTWDRSFLSTVKLISRIRVITHIGGRFKPNAVAAVGDLRSRADGKPEYRVAAIGASTGGPAAVLQILRALPPDFPLPVLVVIHMAEIFATSLSEWLDGQSALRVRYAADGEPLPERGRACVLLAPPGRHLVVSQGRLRLSDAPERHSCRPSVDVLFESVEQQFGPQAIACLLTGMGRDGAAGMLAARLSGAMTIAQDEASSVVFGMPAEAIRLGAAARVLPIELIAPALAELAADTKRRSTL
jgi:two-component system, chemotaxis family, protein-glutamate methylesterase/glutaminase